MLRDRCPVCNVGVLWPNGRMDQDATWYGRIGFGPGDIVLDGDADISPTERGTAAPSLSAHSALARSPISATAELLFPVLMGLRIICMRLSCCRHSSIYFWWHFGRPFVKRFALCYRTVVCSVLSVCLSVTFVQCVQTVGRIKMKLGMQVGLGPRHIVLDGTHLFFPKGGSPQFSAHIGCDQKWLYGSRCHLIWRKDLDQATLY